MCHSTQDGTPLQKANLVLARWVADVVDVGDPRLPIEVADSAVRHGELVVGQGQRVDLLLERLPPPGARALRRLLPRALDVLGQRLGVVLAERVLRQLYVLPLALLVVLADVAPVAKLVGPVVLEPVSARLRRKELLQDLESHRTCVTLKIMYI